LTAPPFELDERHALLLDPREIAEVEYPRALVMGQFENVVVGGTEQMLPENLARVHGIEPAGVARRQILSAFAAVKRRAVGRNCDKDVLVAELEAFCGLDCGDHIGDAGEAQKF
jgi:hypothetical protein